MVVSSTKWPRVTSVPKVVPPRVTVRVAPFSSASVRAAGVVAVMEAPATVRVKVRVARSPAARLVSASSAVTVTV